MITDMCGWRRQSSFAYSRLARLCLLPGDEKAVTGPPTEHLGIRQHNAAGWGSLGSMVGAVRLDALQHRPPACSRRRQHQHTADFAGSNSICAIFNSGNSTHATTAAGWRRPA